MCIADDVHVQIQSSKKMEKITPSSQIQNPESSIQKPTTISTTDSCIQL